MNEEKQEIKIEKWSKWRIITIGIAIVIIINILFAFSDNIKKCKNACEYSLNEKVWAVILKEGYRVFETQDQCIDFCKDNTNKLSE